MQSTLSGALDIIAVKYPDGSIKSTPFHVRFGKLKVCVVVCLSPSPPSTHWFPFPEMRSVQPVCPHPARRKWWDKRG
jgi:hypothetical protein